MKNLIQWLLLLLIVGCSGSVTSVVVTVDAEPGVIARSARLHLVVLGGSSRSAAPTAPRLDRVLTPGGADPAYPFTLTLAPLDGDVGRSYGVTTTAETAGGASVAQARLIGSYAEGRTLSIHLMLEDSCIGIICGDEETCRAGACVDARTGVVGDAGVPPDAMADLGVDLGYEDLGPRDLGPDLGPVDMNVPDLGPVDMNVPDLGPVDLGPADMGSDAGGCTAYRPYTWSLEYRPAPGSITACTFTPFIRTANAYTMAELLPVCLATCTCAVTIEACGVRQSTTCPMAQREEAYVFSRMDTAFTGTQTTHVTGYTYTCIVDIVGTWVSP